MMILPVKNLSNENIFIECNRSFVSPPIAGALVHHVPHTALSR